MNSRWMWLAGLAIALTVAFYLYQRFRIAPGIDFLSLNLSSLDGKPASLEGIGSGGAVICFAASWCGPCRTELSELNQIADELGDIDVIVIGDEPAERLRMFKALGNFPFAFYRLESSFAAVGIHTLPTTYLLNAKGEVKARKTGVIDWLDPSTRTHLISLIKH